MAHGRPAARRRPAETPAQQTVTTACHHCVDPACLTGCPVQRLREGSRHRHRPPPRRPVHRLPVLHADVPVRGAPVQPAARHRPQVRHVQRPPGRRRGAGLRAGLPERGHPHPRRRQPPASQAARAPARSCPGAPSPGPHGARPRVYQTSGRRPGATCCPPTSTASAPRTPTRRWRSCWCSPSWRSARSPASLLGRAAAACRRSGPVALALRGRRRWRWACSALGASVLHLGRPLYACRAVLGLRTRG